MAYYGTLLVCLFAILVPTARLWGIDWLRYVPSWLSATALGISAILPIWIIVQYRHKNPRQDQVSAAGRERSIWRLTVALAIPSLTLLFVLFRTRTHFLGDGYQLLAGLASGNLTTKWTSVGATGVVELIFSWIGGCGSTCAETAYQVYSVGFGVLFLIASAIASGLLFNRLRDRLLFFFGVISGGYSLMFFGYVENYAGFVFVVVAYTFMGMLVAKSGRRYALLLIPLILSTAFHALGVVLIPSAAYLLLTRIRSSKKTPSLVRKHLTKLVVVALATVVGVAIYLYATSFYFRLSILPPFENSLTMGGYTMFSGQHILDWTSLLVMLFPGVLVVAALVALQIRRGTIDSTETRFLLVLTISVLFAAFVLDPKLGMPRDWDLFSFCGIPLVTMGFYVTLRLGQTSRWAGYATVLALALNLIVLVPRVVSQSSAGISERVIEAYIGMDESRCRTAQYTLLKYLEASGRGDEGERLSRMWNSNNSQNRMLLSADTLIARGQYRSALSVLDTLIELNPGIPGAWSKRGHCYFALGQYDSCVSSMNVAIGLNPYNSNEVFNLALVEYHLGHYQAAIEHYGRAALLDSADVRPLIGLAESFAAAGDTAAYHEDLVTLGTRPDAPLKYVRELGDYYWNSRDFFRAAELYKRAIGMGLDSSYAKERLDSVSALRK